MSPERTITAAELTLAMRDLRDVRARHLQRGGDPWAMRQALILVLELDTRAALDHGVTRESLARFDVGARASAEEWLRGRTP